jgi:aspartyl-tRNA(Asn)/glutamyl-tRNA(Gln) amidotransferase subunit C
MSLTQKEIEHIADLARINLNDSEKEKMTRELGLILDYIGKLNEVNTRGIEPIAQITGLENVFRSDELERPLSSVEKFLLSQFPDGANSYLRVKKILTGKK